MKLLIAFSVILSCYLSLGIVLSCTHRQEPSMKAVAPKENTTRVAESQEESIPPMVVQQFGGCKAHR